MKQGFQLQLSPSDVGRSLRHLFYASPFYRKTLMGRTPKSLRAQPPISYFGNPEIGKAIIDGAFTLSHQHLQLGKDPWTAQLDSPLQQADLHGFSWIADLFAVGSDEAQERADDLLRGWIAHNHNWRELSWRPDILGERLSIWLSYFDFLTSENRQNQATLLEAAMIQARHLKRCCTHSPEDARYIRAIQGLIFAAVCLPGAESSFELSLSLLEKEIRRQVFPDGGHFERNPSRVLELLCRFNQIKALLIAAHLEIPVELQGAIDRMPPMLRALRHGDGGLALFNGGLEEDGPFIDRVLADSGVRGRALTSAPHSGFQRLAVGRTVIIVDTGKPPKMGGFNAHAGSLSFEMSVGKDRLIANCGAPGAQGDHWTGALQSTAAHSTLSVDGQDSAKFKSDGTVISSPTNVECLRREADGSVWLDTSHDGFRKNVGIVHRRKLYLDSSGEDFRGEDVVEGAGGKNFCLRFHLHPGVHVSQAEGKSSILFKLAHGDGWQFQASGGSISLEESVYLGGLGEPRRSEQIVISGPLYGDGAQIKWRLHRLQSTK